MQKALLKTGAKPPTDNFYLLIDQGENRITKQCVRRNLFLDENMGEAVHLRPDKQGQSLGGLLTDDCPPFKAPLKYTPYLGKASRSSGQIAQKPPSGAFSLIAVSSPFMIFIHP